LTIEKQAIIPDKMPSWARELLRGIPISPAVKAGGFVFVSGLACPRDRETGAPIEGIEAQTRETLELIKDTLEAAGSSLDKVVKATVHLTNAQDFPGMNQVYRAFFPKDPPARTAVATRLLFPGALVEIECIAVV
jgi:2-iminobutanoate/2-iminopropanoate deaminase